MPLNSPWVGHKKPLDSSHLPNHLRSNTRCRWSEPWARYFLFRPARLTHWLSKIESAQPNADIYKNLMILII